MDSELQCQEQNIRKIEDVIDIQKAKGSYSTRQVVFALSTDNQSRVSANVAKSLETGLSDSKFKRNKKSFKKLQVKRPKGQLPDVLSWPSDSDITVLRMKLDESDLKENVTNTTGDGLHQPDSSSMVNLATLMLQSQTPSKHSVFEEYLLPLTSWDERKSSGPKVSFDTEESNAINVIRGVTKEALSILSKKNLPSEGLSSRDSGIFSSRPRKCRIAKFLRLYFCPCCTCLYEIERMQKATSSDM